MSLNKITVVDKHQDDISETEAGDKFVSWGFIPVPVNTHRVWVRGLGLTLLGHILQCDPWVVRSKLWLIQQRQ